MKLIGLFFIFTFSFTAMAQTREQLLQEYMRERAKMMKEIHKMFQDDFMNDDFFGDSDIDSFFEQKSFSGGGSDVAVEQKYEKDGSISVVITPKNKNINLDISTKNNMITIKSETRVEEENDQNGNKAKSISMSSFSKSIGIPDGYSAKNPVQEGEGIKISLVPDQKIKKLMVPQKKKKSDDKKPLLKPSKEEII